MKKFRDPKTGKVFNSIEAAVSYFRCPGPCMDCPLAEKVHGVNGCVSGVWWKEHPVEAARRMGYEVIDDKEDNMEKTGREGLEPSPTRETEAPNVDVGAGSKPARSRLAEVLGVEVEEKFHIEGFGEYWVTPYGWLRSCTYEDYGSRSFDALSIAINHPKTIIHIQHNRLTEQELAIMRAVGAKWVSRGNVTTSLALLWEVKPRKYPDGVFRLCWYEPIAKVDPRLFPSVKPGDCIGLEEGHE